MRPGSSIIHHTTVLLAALASASASMIPSPIHLEDTTPLWLDRSVDESVDVDHEHLFVCLRRMLADRAGACSCATLTITLTLGLAPPLRFLVCGPRAQSRGPVLYA